MDKPILVVDDEPINYKLLNAILVRNGYKVEYAESGYRAIEMNRANDYSLIIMDIKMSGLDGVETTKQIKQETPNVSVIASSAKGNLEDLEYSLFANFLAKPINREQLLDFVRRYAK